MNSKSVLNRIMALLSVDSEVIELTEAKTRDGAILQSPTFDVGEKVEVISEDGSKSLAPDGEHEISLRDSEGKKVIIKIETKDGVITERENVELKDEKSEEEDMEKKMDEEVVDKKADEEKFADATTEEAKSLPNTTAESDANEVKEDSQKDEPIMKLSYRIDELEKKIKMMEDKFGSAYPPEGAEVSSLMPADIKMAKVDPDEEEEEEELPKLDGAPLEQIAKFAAENKNNFGKKIENSQASFLSKLYR